MLNITKFVLTTFLSFPYSAQKCPVRIFLYLVIVSTDGKSAAVTNRQFGWNWRIQKVKLLFREP